MALFQILWAPCAQAQPDAARNRKQLEEGKRVYEKYCIGCHGEKGDGKGPAARLLVDKPRDFRPGIFKFRSTPSGTLPTDEDLLRTITRGIFHTSMPPHALVRDQEWLAVVQYIKTFSGRWKKEPQGQRIAIPNPPEDLGAPRSVERGRQVFELLECTDCHGDQGKGDGPSAASLDPDAWGNPQKPFNFTRGWLKSGPTPEDIYRTFMTGLNGTAMPSYAEIFDDPDGEFVMEDDAWHLISYILWLRKTSGHAPMSNQGVEPRN